MQVPMRDAGSDRPIVVMKPGNSGGAKGATHPVKQRGQPMWEELRDLGMPSCTAGWEEPCELRGSRTVL